MKSIDQPFDSESTGSSEDSDLIHTHSGEDWVALLDDDMSQPATNSCDTFRITTSQKQDLTRITLLRGLDQLIFHHGLKSKDYARNLDCCSFLLWHHLNNLSVDDNGVIW